MDDCRHGITLVARRMCEAGGRTVVFTGAGMSTESGLPDFRSKNGIWRNVDPMELATTNAMRQDYDRFHAFYADRFEQMGDAAPNRGHEILADWEKRGLVQCIVTQNVDGLHTAAGSINVLELHGSIGSVRCCDCGGRAGREAFIAGEPCAFCGGRLRPGVVLFGEGLPEDALSAAWTEAEKADVFLVLGSSLQVSPANHLPVLAKRGGALLAICNRDVTHLDETADLLCHRGIGEFLAELDAEVRRAGER